MKRTNAEIDYPLDTETMARFAKALGHPVRIRILNILASRQICYTGELVNELPLAQSTISQHLKELKGAGLIQGEILPPKVKYCIDTENWTKARVLFTDFFNEVSVQCNC
jgi:predicted transcriptional regulator